MRPEIEHYFRIEAEELVDGLGRGLLELEREPDRADVLARCFRLAHTLKGAARIAQHDAVGELAHAIEDALGPFRDAQEPVDKGCVSDLLQVLERIRRELGRSGARATPKLTGASAGPAAAPPGPAEEVLDTVRVATADMDLLLEHLSEADGQLGLLRRAAESVARARRLAASLARGAARLQPAQPAQPALDELDALLTGVSQELQLALDGIGPELVQARARAASLRLVPASAIFGQLELAVREDAQVLGKRVDFETSGGDVRVEGQILAVVRESLLQQIHNAVDHGVEPEAERRAAGKPERGRVAVRVEQRGLRIAFQCQDDGRGMDPDGLRRGAVERGLVTAEEAAALDPRAVFRLAFHAGLSTRGVVTQVSGRGVGLDIVRAAAARLWADISVDSEVGQGTTVLLEVPVSTTSLLALRVAAGSRPALLPLAAVRASLHLAPGAIIRRPARDAVLYEGEALPLVPLALLLGAPEPAEPAEPGAAVVVQAGKTRIALGVNRVLGAMDILIRPLPPGAGVQPAIAGAAFDAEGRLIPVLEPAVLLDLALAAPPAGAAPEPRRARPILVIDDSLTTRVLEQSILEAAGYEVDLASSAEEALTRARERRYGLFIVDVEMPGVNGFEFTAATRADPELRQVPVIMVTSLATPAHRRRGAEAGAAAYFAKSEFDHGRFLEKVAELVR